MLIKIHKHFIIYFIYLNSFTYSSKIYYKKTLNNKKINNWYKNDIKVIFDNFVINWLKLTDNNNWKNHN